MNYYSATALDSIPSILKELNASFSNGKTLPIQWRKEQLTKLWNLIDVSSADILENYDPYLRVRDRKTKTHSGRLCLMTWGNR
jgi:hypothetical protein